MPMVTPRPSRSGALLERDRTGLVGRHVGVAVGRGRPTALEVPAVGPSVGTLSRGTFTTSSRSTAVHVGVRDDDLLELRRSGRTGADVAEAGATHPDVAAAALIERASRLVDEGLVHDHGRDGLVTGTFGLGQLGPVGGAALVLAAPLGGVARGLERLDRVGRRGLRCCRGDTAGQQCCGDEGGERRAPTHSVLL